MTTGLETSSSYYIELLNTFPPRPINSKAELIATQNRINSILDQPTLAQDDRDYLKVLGMLVYDYEETHEPIPTLQGINLLKALIEEAQLEPKDLAPILESETIALEILKHQRDISDRQADELAAFFRISPQLLRSVNP